MELRPENTQENNQINIGELSDLLAELDSLTKAADSLNSLTNSTDEYQALEKSMSDDTTLRIKSVREELIAIANKHGGMKSLYEKLLSSREDLANQLSLYFIDEVHAE
jgi:hypothetical protein